jgi:hypothetical protein
MKALKNLLTVVVLSAVIWWLMPAALTVHAQILQCDNYITENTDPCNSCCAGGSTQDGVTDGYPTGAGLQTLSTPSIDCGSSGSCPGPNPDSYCGTGTFIQASNDSSCCIPSGTPCNSGTCCGDLVCLSNNTCGACIQNGYSAPSDSDCCSGFRNGIDCSDYCYPPDYSTCFEDSDCCSGSCIAGYCE